MNRLSDINYNQFISVDLVIDHIDDGLFSVNQPSSYASEGDLNGRTANIQITERGKVGAISGLSINAVWTNFATGVTDITALELIDKNTSVYRFTYPNHMMTAGKVEVKFQLIYNGKVSLTRTFIITVLPIKGNFTALIESQQFSALTQALNHVNQYDTEIAKKADEAIVNGQISALQQSKADKTFVDAQFASIVSGSPKGTFATLAALQAAYPSGTEGVFLVLENGHWYYYASGWKDGGVYQSTQLDDQQKDAVFDYVEDKYNYIDNSTFISGNSFKSPSIVDLQIISVGNKKCLQATATGNIARQSVYYKFDTTKYPELKNNDGKLRLKFKTSISGKYIIDTTFYGGTTVLDKSNIFDKYLEKNTWYEIEADVLINLASLNTATSFDISIFYAGTDNYTMLIAEPEYTFKNTKKQFNYKPDNINSTLECVNLRKAVDTLFYSYDTLAGDGKNLGVLTYSVRASNIPISQQYSNFNLDINYISREGETVEVYLKYLDEEEVLVGNYIAYNFTPQLYNLIILNKQKDFQIIIKRTVATGRIWVKLNLKQIDLTSNDYSKGINFLETLGLRKRQLTTEKTTKKMYIDYFGNESWIRLKDDDSIIRYKGLSLNVLNDQDKNKDYLYKGEFVSNKDTKLFLEFSFINGSTEIEKRFIRAIDFKKGIKVTINELIPFASYERINEIDNVKVMLYNYYSDSIDLFFRLMMNNVDYVNPPFPSFENSTNPITFSTKIALNNAVKYTLNAYWPTEYPGNELISDFGGVTENYLRHPGASSIGVSTLLATNTYDESIVGVMKEDALTANKRIINSLANLHSINGGPWSGKGWQDILWTYFFTASAFLIWEEFTESEKKAIENIVLFASDIILNNDSSLSFSKGLYWKDKTGNELYAGDTKSEEIAWDVSILCVAISMFPQHEKINLWKQKLVEWSIIAFSRPEDFKSKFSVNGYKLSNLNGWNINSDGTVINHNIIHPDYMVAAASSLWGGAALMMHNKISVPKAAFFNTQYLARALYLNYYSPEKWSKPGGYMYIPNSSEVYYPQTNDWGRSRVTDKAAFDILAYKYAFDDDSAFEKFAKLHLSKNIRMQSRFDTGQTYKEGLYEDSYGGTKPYGRESWVTCHLAHAMLALSSEKLITDENVYS